MPDGVPVRNATSATYSALLLLVSEMRNKRINVFYGWWVVLTAALGLCLGSAPIIAFSFSVFLKPLSRAFHAGRGAISLASNREETPAPYESTTGVVTRDPILRHQVCAPVTRTPANGTRIFDNSGRVGTFIALSFQEGKMKPVLVIALLTITAFFPALGQAPDTKDEARSQDEVAIKKLMENVVVAWNTHDGVSFSVLFAEDADFTNWRGTLRIHGREEINQMNANLATGMFRQSTLTLTDAHIRFFAPDVAVVHCDWNLVGAIDYDGKGTMPPRTYLPLFIVTKVNGAWSIAVYQNVLLQPLPPGAIIGPVKK